MTVSPAFRRATASPKLAEVQLDDGVILARDKSGRVVLNRPCHSVDIERSLASAVSLGLIGRA